MSITAIILAHNPERQRNLYDAVNSLFQGTVTPDKVIVFIDTPDINFDYPDLRVKIVRSNRSFPVITRFALGLCDVADRILMIDDDLAVGHKTLENFMHYNKEYPNSLLGLEGNILSKGNEEIYTRGETVDRGDKFRKVDILIRTYFATPFHLINALFAREMNKDKLPEKSIDDIILCMANRSLCYIIPVDKESDVRELGAEGVGQCINPNHYPNRNLACMILR